MPKTCHIEYTMYVLFFIAHGLTLWSKPFVILETSKVVISERRSILLNDDVPCLYTVNKNDFHPKLNAPRKMI
jgi:hypothetical protein